MRVPTPRLTVAYRRNNRLPREPEFDQLDWRAPAEVEGDDPRTLDGKVRLLDDVTRVRDRQEREHASDELATKRAQHAAGRLPASEVCVRRWTQARGLRVIADVSDWDGGCTEAEWAAKHGRGLG